MYRSILRRTGALFLLLALTLALAGCDMLKTEDMEQRVRAMLDMDVAGDREGSYALLFPGTTDEETFRETFQLIQEYFPIIEGYSLTLESYHITRWVGTSSRIVEDAEYHVSFDEQEFRIYVQYVTEAKRSGFTEFRVVSQKDLIGAA